MSQSPAGSGLGHLARRIHAKAITRTLVRAGVRFVLTSAAMAAIREFGLRWNDRHHPPGDTNPPPG